jgi:release factor glutamine methyltransferase
MSMLDFTSAVSVGAARRALARVFAAAGLDNPALDARVLVGHALGLDHAALAAAAERTLEADERRSIAQLAERRLARESVGRIVGVREFWGLPLRITPAVLEPRPDTETLVQTALAALAADGSRDRPLRIADLGTGSAALLLALLSELPHAIGVGTDRSVAALKVARDNARRLGFADRAHFAAGDFGAALAGGFDLVVVNPPYVETAAISALAPEVREHEPRLALDGGADGLGPYRALAADGLRLLAAAGHMVVELGAGQEDAVVGLFAAGGLAARGPAAQDLSGIARALHLRPAGNA